MANLNLPNLRSYPQSLSTVWSNPSGVTNAIVATVPNGEIWIVQSFTGQLTANATVGNRAFQILVTDNLGNTVFSQFITTGNQTASTTIRYAIWPGSTNQSTQQSYTTAFPVGGIQMNPGWKITFQDGNNASATDTWANCVITVLT